ncbi:putative HTH-type transcriptional regulator YfiR [Lachnospiraceae bacterium]|nr:putative HTH-type transcriptional regulator YfiR [Lachnospiraceae bacterium]
MGEKSLQKRKYILEKARGVFCRKGYRAVTMKEIVEACGISRGGLYLHFTNTKDLFEAVLAEEHTDADTAIRIAKTQDISPGEMLLLYLNAQKKVILKKKDNLSTAMYEYLFDNKIRGKNNPVRKQFEASVAILDSLITEGVAQEWMVCDDTTGAARNIMYTLEGLKISSRTIGISADVVDKEIAYIMGTLGMIVK